jgi:hypothetical protein
MHCIQPLKPKLYYMNLKESRLTFTFHCFFAFSRIPVFSSGSEILVFFTSVGFLELELIDAAIGRATAEVLDAIVGCWKARRTAGRINRAAFIVIDVSVKSESK